jgi:hypothetical protein
VEREGGGRGIDVASRLAAAAVVLSLAAVACTGTGLSKRVTTESPASQPSRSGPPSNGQGQGGTESKVLQQVSLQPAELQAGVTVAPITGGDQVEGQVTLDLCAATFPSESLRRSRLQVSAVDQSGTGLGLGTEAVLYKDEAATEQAFRELRSARDKCPDRFVQSNQEGVPPLKYRFEPAPDTAWADVAGVTRLAFRFILTDEQGQTASALIVFLRRGRLLVGVYAFGEAVGVVLAQDVGGVEGLIERVAGRMSDVAVAVVSTSVP